MSYRKKSATAWRGVLLSAAVAIAAVAGLWRMSALYLGTYTVRSAQGSTPFWLFAWHVLALIALIGIAISVGSGGGRKRAARAGALAAVTAVVAIAVVPTFKMMYRSEWKAQRTYGAAITTVREERPGYQARLNIPQARILLSRNLNNAVGTLSDVTYVPNIGDGDGGTVRRYCGLLEQAASLGRIWTKQVACLDPDSGAVSFAEFTGNVGTPSGTWSSSLADQVASVRRGLVFDEADRYGYITSDGDAVLVVPVMARSGFGLAPHDETAGVVLFHADGKREWKRYVAAGEIPGPVVPMAIAEEIREGINANNGLVAYKKPTRSKESLQATNSAGGVAAGDPNAENATEFVLMREDGRLVYSTPLTPYGAGRNVTAWLEVPADEVRAGVLPASTLYRPTTVTVSPVTAAQRITSLYDADIDWLESNAATPDSNKARIYEITPAANGHYNVTVGTGSQVLYHIDVESTLDGNNRFGAVCVYNANDRMRIRCDDSEASPAPLGALRGLGGGAAPSEESDLADVSTEDLIAELARRFPQ